MPTNERAGRPVDPSKDLAIICAARRLLFSEGASAVSIEAVAKLAGVSKVTVYARYSNKDELLKAITETETAQLITGLNISPQKQSDVKEALITFGTHLLSFLISNECLHFMRMLGNPGCFPTEAVDQLYATGPQSTHTKLVQWMKDAHQAGLVQIPQPEKSAEMLLGMLFGIDIVRAMYGQPCIRHVDSIPEHVEWVVNQFLRIHSAEDESTFSES
ncbi:TetR/AcrR family transcriptional regulator [Nitrincola tibetensis]|uniref:TetR/AcrR family transcriptional regulator n=1 Tax=Nitrincola tibetensis TaxID=2219697 RepID=UPI00138FF07F|nr:TetR/AcrR family transcriptional regulator [Nitrincola tibetensis]